MLKHQAKSHKAIGSIIAILFIISAIVIAFALVEFGLTAQQKQAEIQQKTYEAQAKATDIIKSINSVWYYDDLSNMLTINITNNYVEPIAILGLAILYSDGSVNMYNTTLPTESGNLNLPYTLLPGDNVKIEIYSNKEPVAIRIAIHSHNVVIAASAKEYVTPTIIAQPQQNYTIALAPYLFTNYTVATLGYNSTETPPLTPSGYGVLAGTVVQTSPLKINSSQITYYMFPEYKEWQYYREISIIEETGSDLSNYQVKIILNSSNFDFTKPKSDGSDIRFLRQNPDTNTYEPLSYWIEKWDPIGQEAIIWVKIPLLKGGQTTTIYMLYGNPSATYDTTHYGLTKIIEPLPASDGANYIVYYETWNMNEQLFDGNQGNSTGWDGDDSTWMYPLPFSFPYYSETYNIIYICSNGFVGTTYNGNDGSSSDEEFYLRGMIAPFWADLRTDVPLPWIPDVYDVFINDNYSDIYGQGVYIRWLTTFHYYWLVNGQQNFAVVLYSNGLIRFDYGDLYGISNTDYTGVVGISFGDGDHYTKLSNNTDGDSPSLWDNHNSVMLWPRKKASTEPTITISVEKSNTVNGYMVSAVYWWSNITPTSIVNLYSSFEVLPAVSFSFYVFENSSGSWNVLYSGSSLPPSPLLVNRYFSVGSTGFMFNVTSTSPFNLTVYSVEITSRTLDLNKPLIVAVMNGSSKLFIYDVSNDVWSAKSLGGVVVNPYVTFSFTNTSFYILNYTHILKYDPYMNDISYGFDVDSIAKDSAFIMALYNGSNWLIYSQGGGNDTLVVYSLDNPSKTPISQRLPETIGAYTCTAIDNGSNGYIMVGGSGNIYLINVYADGSLYYERVPLTPSTPTVYPVGLTYGDNSLWVIGKGGGIYEINVNLGSVIPLTTRPPYYPMSEGDRLVYINEKLYHIREDGTSEILVYLVQR